MTPSPAWLRCVAAVALLACVDAPESTLEDATTGRDGASEEVADMEPHAPDSGAKAAANVAHTGTLRTTGPPDLQVVTLSTIDGTVLPLEGARAQDLKALSGAVVSVRGAPLETPTGLGLDVTDFDLVSIDGAPAIMGVLTESEGIYWLDSSPDVRLGEVPNGLAQELGSLVWVTGSEDGDDFRIQSFGVISAR